MAENGRAHHSGLLSSLLLTILLQVGWTSAEELKWDENGYILYCPCMGNSNLTTRSHTETYTNTAVVLEKLTFSRQSFL